MDLDDPGGDAATDATQPVNGVACLPCLVDEDCTTGARCLPASGGTYCLATGCDAAPGAAATCPSGAPCTQVGDVSACVPAACACTADGEGRSMSCKTAVGCPGTKTCHAGAFDACQGPAPEPELCNGKDDDCNGATDDGGADASCDDGVACTIDHCIEMECNYIVYSSSCLIDLTCWAEGEVRPGSPCESCKPNASQAQWTSKAEGAACDDGSGCTAADRCQGGQCAGDPVDCSDGLDCTLDACVGGVCQTHVLAPGTCLIDGACRAAGEHNPASSCLACVPAVSAKGWSVLAKGTACDDGNACTDADACDGLQCGGVSKACTPSAPCAEASCQDGKCIDLVDSTHCLVEGACVEAGAAEPGNPCRTCQPEVTQAAYTPHEATCSDGKVCTIQDHCQSGECVGGLPICKCEADVDCQDDDLCNGTETCDHSSETSSEWHCVAGLPLAPCAATAPASCTVSVCDPTSGQCITAPAADVTPCSDGSVCTGPDVCTGGACSGKLIDCDDGSACTGDACDPGAGCTHAPIDDADCDDGDACTAGDACQAGACVPGTLVCGCQKDADCPPSDPCLGHYVCEAAFCAYVPDPVVCDTSTDPPCVTTVCAPEVGSCLPVLDPEGEPCDDGDPCTVGDGCDGGGCTGAAVIDCDDGEPCTADACVGGCQHAPMLGPCDDGDPCTGDDACQSGACAGSTTLCECQSDADCPDDGNLCNGIPYCEVSGKTPAYTCLPLPGSVVTCTGGASAPCQTVACVPATGSCAAAAQPDGTGCDDGKSCTSEDHCSAGACTGTTTGCDDGLGCTADACGTNGCVHAVVPGACLIDAACWQDGAPSPLNLCLRCASDVTKTSWSPKPGACDDGSQCTPSDSCQNGQCTGAGSLDCDDKNACTGDACDAKEGCKHTPESHACDDGDTCTTGDTCQAGKCVAGPIGTSCSDGNPCTDDGCNLSGCIHAPNANPCDDANACTSSDTCQASACKGGPAPSCDDQNPCTTDTCKAPGGCVHDPLGSGSCEDGSQCTTGDTCQAGACKGGPAPSCDDANVCTVDACKSASGCTHEPTAGSCEDGLKCTANDTCQGGLCKGGAPPSCSDGNECTEDSCVPTAGCQSKPLESGTCSDGNLCTEADHCAKGSCTGTTKSCTDNNPCTTDTCASSSGSCGHALTAGPCDDGNPCTYNDACGNGGCMGTSACNDWNECTKDGCNDTGCTHEWTELTPCNDGDPCTLYAFCFQGTCYAAEKNGCNDFNTCTKDFCWDGVCYNVPMPGYCNDLKPCTCEDKCYDGKCQGTWCCPGSGGG